MNALDYDRLTELAEIVAANMSTVEITEERPPAWQTWLVGLAFVSLCSFTAPLGLLILPCLSKLVYERVMALLIALGIGTLSGSCFFILVPQAFELEADDNTDFSAKSFIIVAAIYAFYLLDRLLQYFLEYRRRRAPKAKLEKKPSRVSMIMRKLFPKFFHKKKNISTIAKTFDDVEVENQKPEETNNNESEEENCEMGDRTSAQEEDINNQDVKVPIDDDSSADLTIPEKAEAIEEEKLEIASFAYLIVIGASANNFMDAMSLGTGFSESLMRGINLGIASYSQQLPQEVGTLAILVHSGLGIRRTLIVNFIPAVLSYLGFSVGVLMNSFAPTGYAPYVFSVSSGMYLYVFLGTLLPEIRTTTEDMIRKNLRESILHTILQFAGIAFGVTFIFFMNKVNGE